MCSNMCARPVLSIGSCTDPASTCAPKEITGASGRSQILLVSPLANFFTAVRFSKEARSCPRASEHTTQQTAIVSKQFMRTFILPPGSRCCFRVAQRFTAAVTGFRSAAVLTAEGQLPHSADLFAIALPMPQPLSKSDAIRGSTSTNNYQTLHAFSDTIGCPALQVNAC